MLKEDQNKLYVLIDDYIKPSVIKKRNRSRKWEYGYNEDYDIVVISKDGTIGDIISIKGLLIALPSVPKECEARSRSERKQYWERKEEPRELQKNQVYLPMEQYAQ